MKRKLLVSSSVINFRERAEKIWKLERYSWPRDMHKPVLFFGMYHIGDYLHYLLHKGEKIIFWAGSDIISLKKNYLPWYMLFRDNENYTENPVEYENLREMGILSHVVPSFLENIDDWPVTYRHSDKPHVFMTAHPFREEEYGVMLVVDIAKDLPDITFHIYGINGPELPNVKFHGIVPEEQFNEEIKHYQGSLRTNKFDGCSEVMVKSILGGQYTISYVEYDGVSSYRNKDELIVLLKKIKDQKEPNYKLRELWINKLNQYPWMNEIGMKKDDLLKDIC